MIHAERAERMKPILDRIPERWGKSLPWPEWDDILLELDAEIAKLHPDYEVHQAKVKFGDLRYYTDHDDDPKVAELIRGAERKAWEMSRWAR